MIGGALGGLLVAIAYTLITGKLQLTKSHIVYGVPARVSALFGLIPLEALGVYFSITAQTVLQPGGLGLFAGTLVASILFIYGAGWRFGEPPR